MTVLFLESLVFLEATSGVLDRDTHLAPTGIFLSDCQLLLESGGLGGEGLAIQDLIGCAGLF